MDRGSLRLLTLIPTPGNLREAMANFASTGYGRILGFDDETTRLARNFAPPDANIEITSLQDFVGACLTLAGVRRNPPASEVQLAEAVRYAISKCPKGSFLDRSAQFVGTQRRVARVLREFREAGLDSFGIRALAAKVGEPLAKKLSCLADVEQGVEEVLSHLGTETYQSRLVACLQTQWPVEMSSPRVMLVLGTSTNPLIEKWIEWTLAQGINLTLVAFDHPLQASFETAKHIAKKFSIEPEAVGFVPEPCASLFSDLQPEQLALDIAIESCFEPLAECEWVLRRIREDLHRGILPTQIGIFVRDVEGYARLLELAAERLEVPISLMRVSTVDANRCFRWVVRLLKALAHSKPSAFFRALDETYSHLTPEERSATRSTLRDSLRFGENAWSVFAQGIAPLDGGFWIQEAISMREECSQLSTRRDWLAFLERVLEFKPLFDMRESVAELDRRDSAALRLVHEGFRQRMEVSPDEVLDYQQFIEDLEAIASSIPEVHEHAPNAVRTSSTPTQLLGCECLYVVGLLEGVFPRRRSEDPILTDLERAKILEVLGPMALSDSRSTARSERDLFLQLVAAPLRKLTLTYPTSSEERDNVPAFYLAEIERACGENLRRIHHPRGEWAPRQELPNMAAADKALSEVLTNPLPAISDDVASDPAVLAEIQVTEDRALSPQDLRDALLCRFRFTCRTMLGIRSRHDADPEAAARRAAQAVRVDAIASMEDFKAALERNFSAELDMLLGLVDERELTLIRAAGRRLFAKLVASEEQARKYWARNPESIVSPAWFDGEALSNELTMDDEPPLKLAGRIESVGKLGRLRVASVRGVSADLATYQPSNASDADKLVAGIYLAALKSPDAAVELVGVEGERTFLVLERNDSTPQADVRAGLRVASVDRRETGFFKEVKRLAKEARKRARENRFEADPGEHCSYCEFSALCRKAWTTEEVVRQP